MHSSNIPNPLSEDHISEDHINEALEKLSSFPQELENYLFFLIMNAEKKKEGKGKQKEKTKDDEDNFSNFKNCLELIKKHPEENRERRSLLDEIKKTFNSEDKENLHKSLMALKDYNHIENYNNKKYKNKKHKNKNHTNHCEFCEQVFQLISFKKEIMEKINALPKEKNLQLYEAVIKINKKFRVFKNFFKSSNNLNKTTIFNPFDKTIKNLHKSLKRYLNILISKNTSLQTKSNENNSHQEFNSNFEEIKKLKQQNQDLKNNLNEKEEKIKRLEQDLQLQKEAEKSFIIESKEDYKKRLIDTLGKNRPISINLEKINTVLDKTPSIQQKRGDFKPEFPFIEFYLLGEKILEASSAALSLYTESNSFSFFHTSSGKAKAGAIHKKWLINAKERWNNAFVQALDNISSTNLSFENFETQLKEKLIFLTRYLERSVSHYSGRNSFKGSAWQMFDAYASWTKKTLSESSKTRPDELFNDLKSLTQNNKLLDSITDNKKYFAYPATKKNNQKVFASIDLVVTGDLVEDVKVVDDSFRELHYLDTINSENLYSFDSYSKNLNLNNLFVEDEMGYKLKRFSLEELSTYYNDNTKEESRIKLKT